VSHDLSFTGLHSTAGIGIATATSPSFHRSALSLACLTAQYHHNNMAEPPSYEESTSGSGKSSDYKGDFKTHPQSSIKDEVDLSRSQHVGFIVPKIMEHIRERARQGLSKTTLALIPSDQGTLDINNAKAQSNAAQMQVEKAQSSPSPTAKCRL
jgi:hypothetical protein